MTTSAKISKNNQPDDIDYEVDEMLKMVRSNKFKSGIYNFCDRWCERCKKTEKCFLYAQEMRRNIRKVLAGKDNGGEDWIEDVKHNLEITRRLIERGMREDGLDPQKILKEKPEKSWDDNAHKRYDKVPCLVMAKEYMKKVFKFLNNFHKKRFQYYEDLDMEVSYHDVCDEIETISWYHTLIPVKIWRVLHEKEALKREKNKELKKLMQNNFKKYCVLVSKCLIKSKKFWRSLAEKRKELNKKALDFVTIIGDLENEFQRTISA